MERFNREAKTLARLGHPNIVGVFDFGTAGPCCYLLMEYVDGVNLRQAMQAGGFTPAEALQLVCEIRSALKYAHEEGILHRDIKPENILIDSKGRVKIADFGIAKMIGEGERSDVTLTLQGSVLGSPHYMAPEQFITPGDIDQRADIHSLGVVLCEMLTGELPIGRFDAPTAKVAMMDTRTDEIVTRTFAKEREARFQSAEEVRTSVNTVVQDPGGATPTVPVSSRMQRASRFSPRPVLVKSVVACIGIVAFCGPVMAGFTLVSPKKPEIAFEKMEAEGPVKSHRTERKRSEWRFFRWEYEMVQRFSTGSVAGGCETQRTRGITALIRFTGQSAALKIESDPDEWEFKLSKNTYTKFSSHGSLVMRKEYPKAKPPPS